MNPRALLIPAKWVFTRRPTTAAIDITHRCNLQCLHCYWWRQEHPRELSDREWVSFMTDLRRKRRLRAAILYGGEPALRPGVCLGGSRIFDSTLVFTNGTMGLPGLRNGQWIVSLDGPREINDAVRGEGVYDEAVRNIQRAARPPIVHMTLCRMNQHAIEPFVREMLELPIKGIGFSFYTPMRNREEPELFIPLAQRNRTVDHLLALKERYGPRVGFTPAMGRQFRTDGAFPEWNDFDRCPVGRRVLCYASDGTEKRCTYGDDADCSRCGCAAVSAYRGSLKPPDIKTMRVVMGLVFPGAGTRLKRSSMPGDSPAGRPDGLGSRQYP